MAFRTRTTQLIRPAGYGTAKGYISNTLVADNQTPAYTVYYATCTDVTGSPKQDHILGITKKRASVKGFNGVQPSSTDPARFELKNWMSDNDAIWNPQIDTLPETTTVADCANDILKRSNPNKYKVNGPVSLLELREIPGLIRDYGRNIIDNAAGGNLKWQFGWKPLMSDLDTVFNFQEEVTKKSNYILKLYRKQGLRYKRVYEDSHKVNSGNFQVFSWQGKQGYYLMDISSHRKRWATVRWMPTTLPPQTNAELRKKAIRLVYGLELSPSNIWEAIPWSWLTDWFSNVGDYLSLYNNVVPCTPSTPCVMTTEMTTRTFTPVYLNCSYSGGDATSIVQTKSRALQGFTLTGGIPFLTGRQLSILGSLAVLRLRK